MIPTVQQILDTARLHLGDTEVSGGQLYTDDGASGTVNLRTYLDLAYQRLFERLNNIDSQAVEATRYFDVPAHQSYIDPKSFGANDVGELEVLRSRRRESASVILSATPDAATPQQYVDIGFAAPHGRTDGNEVVIYNALGISDDINDRWTVTAPTATSLRLLGCTSAGSYTANSGTMSYSGEGWSEPYRSVDSDDVQSGQFRVIGERIRIYPADHVRQFLFQLTLSGRLPASDSGSVLIDGSLNYLSAQTAGLALGPRNRNRSETLLRDAAVAMESLVQGMVRGLQKNRYQTQRWREKRNVGSDMWVSN